MSRHLNPGTRRHLRGAYLTGILLLGTVGSLMGQQRVPPPLDSIGHRIETLRSEMDAAQALAIIADSLYSDSMREANQIPLDTILVGPLRIATVPNQREIATEVFEEIWGAYQPLVRGSEEVLSDHLFIFRWGWRFEGMYLQGEKVHSVEINRRWGKTALKNKVRDGLGQALLAALRPDSSGLRDWVGQHPLTPPLDWSWIYRELASTPSTVVKQCYRGETAMCWEAMGLSEGGNQWLTWYSKEERRLLVETAFANRLRYSYRYGYGDQRLDRDDLFLHGCVELNVDRACIEILSEWAGRIPLGTASRASMVAEALTQGGEGAFTRLLSDPGASLKDRLAHAAGLHPDTLAARWRERVMGAEPSVQADLVRAPLSMVFWLALLLFFAIRSTPWRLG
jgi:hypothetical protein